MTTQWQKSRYAAVTPLVLANENAPVRSVRSTPVRDSSRIRVHGYVNYTIGCRCQTCRAAKTEYMRDRREQARRRRAEVEAGGDTFVASGITHGRAGYDNEMCRCPVCCSAKRASAAAYAAARRAGRGAR